VIPYHSDAKGGPVSPEKVNLLLKELETELDSHARWQGHDFVLAQTLLWIGIGASALSSLLVAMKLPNVPQWLAITLPALPGIALVVDKTFKYAARSAWHAIYGVRLKALLRELNYRAGTENDVSKLLDELQSEMQALFPPLDLQAAYGPNRTTP
jgi:hypothetical protein